MVFENIFVEKYQVIILFFWNFERVLDVINIFDYNVGCMYKFQYRLELYEVVLLLVRKCMYISIGRNKS